MLIGPDDVPMGRVKVFADGKPVSHVIWFSTKTGEIVRAKTDDDGEILVDTENETTIQEFLSPKHVRLEFDYGP